jgi:hypothetical protein
VRVVEWVLEGYTNDTLSDEPQHTYSAREIVLELFPATPERLVPNIDDYRLESDPDGNLIVLNAVLKPLLTLIPISSSGKASTYLCCDFCRRNAPRYYAQIYRVEVPASQGRRFRYFTLCKNLEECSARRFDDKPIRALLSSVFNES